MGFTTPVFILKNTPELRDKLVRLGYKIGYEWFVYPPENIWFICDDDDINYARENIKDSVQAAWFHCSHKATVKELIEHFKSV